MKLSELSPAAGSVKARKRVGRGVGSGNGRTAGRGEKGHNARSGGGVRPGFEGGQMPLQQRLPKRGFTNIFKKKYAIINVMDLEVFEEGSVIDDVVLIKAGMAKGRIDGVKILGDGELKKSFTVKSCLVSKSAKEKIEAAGGKVEA